MLWVGRVAATRVWAARDACGAGALLLLALAGCSGTVQVPSFVADAPAPTNAVAINSLDGPPSQISQKYFRDLSDEASARHIAVVPREGSAPYRLRGYLAVHQRAGATAVAWAWDIYDGSERRTFRLNGEETAKPGNRSWAAADDELLRRIARSSVEQLAVFLANPPPSASRGSPSMFAEKGRALLSQIDDFTPEASGIFRVFRNDPEPVEIGAGATDGSPLVAAVPLPPERPAPTVTDAGALAFTDSEQ